MDSVSPNVWYFSLVNAFPNDLEHLHVYQKNGERANYGKLDRKKNVCGLAMLLVEFYAGWLWSLDSTDLLLVPFLFQILLHVVFVWNVSFLSSNAKEPHACALQCRLENKQERITVIHEWVNYTSCVIYSFKYVVCSHFGWTNLFIQKLSKSYLLNWI